MVVQHSKAAQHRNSYSGGQLKCAAQKPRYVATNNITDFFFDMLVCAAKFLETGCSV